ncbi:Phenylcoumaran benzylic ether reductase [Heracleum sosnowskyi]|uniref:Phenylcoumaran benzylic ether reductase n=1 Tax=Heracleum sosnowskyi TaxID=360622 RepID=A0AAD8MYU7_9APIA|nr:Phenylcoumaran benzylic ether reductase [Heracleum sosnowskyi]
MAEKSKILVIGATGYIGKFLAETAANLGHQTFALVRESAVSDPVKGKLIESFKSSGVTIIYGDIHDHENLVKGVKQVDVVISAVGFHHVLDQFKILDAIEEAGNVKRFIPSEFGADVDRTHAVEPAKTTLAEKVNVRRAIEAHGIPYTYITTGCFAGYFLPTLAQLGGTAPPREKVIILGDGTPKAVFTYEQDIATYTIKTVDDPRTVNKTLYIMPPHNIHSMKDLVGLWEKKIDKVLEKIHVPEGQVLKQIEEAPVPQNRLMLSIFHSIFIKGDQTNFEREPSLGLEASQLYPHVKYTTVDEYLHQFV